MNALRFFLGESGFYRRLSYVVLLVALLAPYLPVAQAHALAYVDPSLLGMETQVLPVIVRGQTSASAAKTVKRIGGEVTKDLWIIDSVAASIPASALMQLAGYPGIQSVFANKGVQAADEPFDGWVTPRRILDETRNLRTELQTTPVALPDGAIVLVSKQNKLHILNEDGSERKVERLAKGDYPNPPIVDTSGTLYLSGDNKITYVINSAGVTLWTYTHAKRVTAVALDEVTSTLFIGDSKGRITALDTTNKGQERWQKSVGDGDVTAIRIGDQGQNIVAVTEDGYIVAFNSVGRQTWVARQAEAAPFRHVALNPLNGILYVVGGNRWLYGLHTQGSGQFRLRMPDKITSELTFGVDGVLFAGLANGTLSAINPDGSTRFQSSLGHQPITDLALSPNGTALYALSNNQVVYGLATTDGKEHWRHETSADGLGSLFVDNDGFIHFVNGSGDYSILNEMGMAIDHFELGSPVSAQPTLGSDRRRRVYVVSEDTLFVLARMPDNRQGQQDVYPTDTPGVFSLANPITVDIGADMLHRPQLPNQAPITGAGVTVAIVDSGVQYSEEVQRLAGERLSAQFLGQADFVEKTCPEANGIRRGQQEDGYCFQNATYSRDEHGHGSHVAGIIWNQYRDAATNTFMGVAPDVNLLSVRILDADGMGSYADAIEGIQYVVANQKQFNIRVLNLSISALAITPYFVDPINQAVQRAWANGIVVLAAAGNEGPEAGSITVPGNAPYIITVGAIDSKRTPGYWMGDTLPEWSATGPTHDGFIKPDILAPGVNIVSTVPESATISQEYPKNRVGAGLFRMNGTSMSTAVVSGVVALMLQAAPSLVPDQVKYRLAHSARPAVTAEGYPVHSILQQGMGRIWAPTAVLGVFDENGYANQGMDIESDLAHGWISPEDRKHHYQGAVQRLLSDDERTYLYVIRDGETAHGIGATDVKSQKWLSWEEIAEGGANEIVIADEPKIAWAGGIAIPSGMATWAGGMATWAGGTATWATGMATWAGGMATWAGGMATWAGGMATWAGGMATWAGGMATWAGGMATWAGGINTVESILASTTWVNDDGTTAEFQGNTVLNPVPDDIELRPSPWTELGTVHLFLPVVER